MLAFLSVTNYINMDTETCMFSVRLLFLQSQKDGSVERIICCSKEVTDNERNTGQNNGKA